MYDATEPLYYAVRSLSLAIFSSSRTLNCSRNFAAKSVKLVGAMPNRSRRSSHLLALPLHQSLRDSIHLSTLLSIVVK